jgi:hypothetical protein
VDDVTILARDVPRTATTLGLATFILLRHGEQTAAEQSDDLAAVLELALGRDDVEAWLVPAALVAGAADACDRAAAVLEASPSRATDKRVDQEAGRLRHRARRLRALLG